MKKQSKEYHFDNEKRFICKCGGDKWSTHQEQVMCRYCYTLLDYKKWYESYKKSLKQIELL